MNGIEVVLVGVVGMIAYVVLFWLALVLTRALTAANGHEDGEED